MTQKQRVLAAIGPVVPQSQEYIHFSTWDRQAMNYVPAASVRRIVQELHKAGKIVIADRRGYRQAPRFLLAPVAPVAPAATIGQA